MDHDCCETIRACRPWTVVEKDIRSISATDLQAAGGLVGQEIDLLAGGPPCQAFSKAGYWLTGDSPRMTDPRATMVLEFMRLWKECLPRVVVFENVSGLAYRGKTEALDYIKGEIDTINGECETSYRPTIAVLRAADFGVPQTRERLFLVADRDGGAFDFDSLMRVETQRTAWDAVGDLDTDDAEELRVRGKWSGLLSSIPEGHNYLYHTERGKGVPLFGWRRRYWSFLLKLAKNRPSWTISAQPGPANGPFHWSNRRLSVRELCRLQTLPDDVHIVGSRTSAQRQIGNAVPSLLAEIIGRAIKEQLLGFSACADSPTLLPARKGDPPPPEPITAVPSIYLPLRGQDTAHPGTGLGRRAVERTSPN